jgi:hypothetical protein
MAALQHWAVALHEKACKHMRCLAAAPCAGFESWLKLHLKGPMLQSAFLGSCADATGTGCSSASGLTATGLNMASRLRLLPAAGRFLPFFWLWAGASGVTRGAGSF